MKKIIWILLIALSGCGKIALKKPTVINLNIQADAQINPDDSGRSSPVVVKLYALSSIGQFNALDFDSLYDSPNLKEILLSEEYYISPGSKQIHTYELPANALYIGVIAAFRHIDTAQWRATTAVPTGRTSNFIIQIRNDHISIQAQ